MYIADLHIHSRFSRATSKEGDAPHLDLWARYKGIGVVGTGDFTHPAWRQELGEMLVPAEEGFYTLRPELRLEGAPANVPDPRFVITGEISTIYKKNGRTRKVHHVILLPSLEAAEALSQKLEAIGNLHSDGRPILGLDSRDLLEIVLETCPEAVYIPAHIWTPHFSLFGAFSGFDTIEECYEDLTPYVHALETGLSSDPPMNWQVSALDGLTLVSHSDAHSPQKLGREADVIDTELSYPAMARAIQTGEGFAGTLEFFPEEGKYHLDGHRNCRLCLEPSQALELGGRCPVCGKKLTIGVQHRVEELADRPAGFRPANAKPFESLMPLPELIASSTGLSAGSKKVQEQYFHMLRALGPEFTILREAPLEEVSRAFGPLIAEGLRRMRAGEVRKSAGYDGEYGVISVFSQEERENFLGQTSLFQVTEQAILPKKPAKKPVQKAAPSPAENAPTPAAGLNPEQQAAVESTAAVTAVVAGPGAGKTRTLIARIAWLLQSGRAKPSEITAVTFTQAAAQELRSRLEEELGGKKALRGLTVGTFHGVSLSLLERRPLLSDREVLEEIRSLLTEMGSKESPKKVRAALSNLRNGLPGSEEALEALAPGMAQAYEARLQSLGARDVDSLLRDALQMDVAKKKCFTHVLVDEFQDINPVQRQLVAHWSRHSKSLFVIGDPDQSIYGFRGADAACFDRLLADFPEAACIRLTDNYRSAPAILQAAGAVIGYNPGEERVMKAHAPAASPVRLIQAATPFDESVWIAKEIRRMTGGVDMLEAQEMGGPEETPRSFSEIAVLCRTRRRLEQVEKALIHDSIPCVVSGRGRLLEEDDVQGALAFYRFLLNSQDTVALATCLRLVWDCPAHLVGWMQEIFSTENPPGLAPLWEELGGFGHLALWLEEYEKGLPLVKKEKPRKLLDGWRERHGDSPAMEQLCETAVFYDTMADLLNALDLGEEGDVRRGRKRYPSGAVRLMTLHAAKGLEFPVVFLAGLEEGTLPLEREGEPVNLEEERRLFFVGMTRAREELLLTSGGKPSAFAGELPREVLRETARSYRKPEVQQLSFF